MSLPEVLLWQRLRRRSMAVKFRRQHPVGPYALDFYCPQSKVAFEIDGEAHNRGDRPARDIIRDAFIADHGIKVVRVPATQVLSDPDTAAEAIAALAALPLHHPSDGPPPHAAHGEDLSGAD
jgi:very-short-patch-repair endonuclease